MSVAIAVAFMAGFWLGGAFLAFAIAWTQGDPAERTIGLAVFALLWPFTIMADL